MAIVVSPLCFSMISFLLVKISIMFDKNFILRSVVRIENIKLQESLVMTVSCSSFLTAIQTETTFYDVENGYSVFRYLSLEFKFESSSCTEHLV